MLIEFNSYNFSQNCRRMVQPLTDTNQVYYFDGCFAKFEDQVKKNKEVVIWATVGAALVMVNISFIILPHLKCYFSGCDVTDSPCHVHDGGLKTQSNNLYPLLQASGLYGFY